MVLRYNQTTEIDFFMPDDTDPWTGKTGLTTISVQYKKQGQSAFTTLTSPTITELGNGWYKLSVPTAMVDTYGFLVVRFTATGAKTQQQQYQVVAFNPYDSAGLGLSRIDAAISSRSTLTASDVQTALTNQGYTTTRAGYLDRLDTTVSSRSTLTTSDVQTALTNQGYTTTRAGHLDRLDTTVSSRMPAGSVTVGGYASGQDPATLVWGASTRTLTSVLNVVSGSSTTIADQIWNRLRSDDTRPNGSFGYYLDARVGDAGGGSGVSDWSSDEKEQIRYVLGIDGAKAAPTGNTGWIPGIKARTDQLTFTGSNVNARVTAYGSGLAPAEQVLSTPSNKLATDASGRVTVGTNNDKTGYELSAAERTSIASSVWSHTTRTLTSFGSLVSDIWNYSTRTLTSFGTLASDTAAAVWNASTRTLTSFGTLVSDIWSYSTRTLTSFGSLVSDVASAVWSYTIETSQSALAWMRLMGAVLFGKRVVSGGTESYRDWNDSKNRVVGSVDSSGNRTITTRDGS